VGRAELTAERNQPRWGWRSGAAKRPASHSRSQTSTYPEHQPVGHSKRFNSVDSVELNRYNEPKFVIYFTIFRTLPAHHTIRMIEAVFFYLFAGLMLLAALSVILTRQPVYSVLSLLAAMFCLASLFVMLGAYFVAAIQVLLYAGAVLVLFLFVIMLLNLEPKALAHTRAFTLRAAGTGAALWLLFLLTRLLRTVNAPGPLTASPAPDASVESIGRLLFSTYLLPFELTSFLILAAIIGAVTLAKQQPRK